MIERLLRVALLGNSWVFYWLFGWWILSVGVMVDRWIFFHRRRDDTEKLGDNLVARLRHGDVAGADQILAASTSFEAAAVRPALLWLDGGPAAVEDALEAEVQRKRRELRRGMVALGTIARSAPFVGLLGVVIAVIHAVALFSERSSAGDFGEPMAVISHGFVAGGMGLFVATLAVIAYDVLGNKVSDVESNIGVLAKLLLAHLKTRQVKPTEAIREISRSSTEFAVATHFQNGEAPEGRASRLRQLD